MPQIDYYFSTLSPWSYLAGMGLEQIAARHGAQITYRPLDIMALFARTGGTPPGDRHPNRLAYRDQELARWSRQTGLDLNPRPAFWPTNPAPSSYAIIAAQDAGGGDLGKLVHSLLRAVWAEDRDIAQDDVIGQCLELAGFSSMLTLSGMVSGAQTYADNLERAVSAGVFGAPFYITSDDGRFWGQDRLDMLDQHLKASA